MPSRVPAEYDLLLQPEESAVQDGYYVQASRNDCEQYRRITEVALAVMVIVGVAAVASYTAYYLINGGV